MVELCRGEINYEKTLYIFYRSRFPSRALWYLFEHAFGSPFLCRTVRPEQAGDSHRTGNQNRLDQSSRPLLRGFEGCEWQSRELGSRTCRSRDAPQARMDPELAEDWRKRDRQ